MKKFLKDMFRSILRPHKTFDQLVKDKNSLRYGACIILIIGFLYTITVIMLAASNAKIITPAWINIPAEKYYFWEIFFALPIFAMGWIFASSLIYLTGKVFIGQGSFDSTLAVMGFAFALPCLLTWIPETIGSILFATGLLTQKEWLGIIARPGFWRVFADIYQFIALAWYIILFPIGAYASLKTNKFQSILIGIFSLAVTGFILFIFIR